MNLRDSSNIAWSLGYNRSFVAVFTSCTDPNAPFWDINATYVANSPTGYYTEYEKTFQSATDMGTRARSASNVPYSTCLRPVTNLAPLFASESVWFEKAKFSAYDAMKSGSTFQNAANNTAIINGITSATFGAWNSSRWLNGEVALTGVNYFRPGIFYNDGGTILDTLNTQVQINGANHQGDQSVGLDLPFCLEGGYALDSQVENLLVYAGAAQYINGDVNAPLVRYPVKCTLFFKLKGIS